MVTVEELKLNLSLFDDDTQVTTQASLAAEIKTYYEKRLISTAEPLLIHDQFGQKRPIPKGGGKTIEFRKYSSLPNALVPLTEGITPKGNSLNVSTITASVDQYGDWVQLSDLLDLTAIDKNVEEATKMLGNQAGKTLDAITRDVVIGGSQVIYAPWNNSGTLTAITDREDITARCLATPALFSQAAALLKTMNAPPFGDSYVAIVHPYVAYDLMQSEGWIEAHKYATPENIYRGELGKIGQVRFVETSQAKIIAPENICDILPNRTTLQAAVTTSADVKPNFAISAGDATAINAAISAGAVYTCYVAGSECTIASVTAGAVGTAKITMSASIASAASGATLCGPGAGADGSAVFLSMVLAEGAYGVTEIEGGGLQHIVKQLGYGEDPLNQRSSTGWKATKVAERLVEEYMVRIESGSSFSAKAQSN